MMSTKLNQIVSIQAELNRAQAFLHRHYGLVAEKIVEESESSDYGAHRLVCGEQSVLFRIAKITPTKAGLFVTLWQRDAGGPIKPFDAKDMISFVIINVQQNDCHGYFVFPNDILMQQKIFSSGNVDGKRAFRLYPPWCTDLNAQATKTQKWQLKYFLKTP